eukprot:ANDGO_05424.mRNA.1 FACT complex subunit SPT16
MPSINANLFYGRLNHLFQSWESSLRDLWQEADSFSLISGKDNDEKPPITKTSSVQSYLTGYELTDTLFVFLRAEKEVHVFVSSKRKTIFDSVVADEDARKKAKCEARMITHERSSPEFPEAEVAKVLRGKTRIGHIFKELEFQIGKFAEGYRKWAKNSTIDVSSGVSDVFEIKDESGIESVKKAADLSACVMTEVAKAVVQRAVEKRVPIKHSEMSEKIAEAFSDPAQQIPSKKVELDEEEATKFDSAFPPIIQSGENVDLSLNAENTDGNVRTNAVVVMLGARHLSFTSLCARTFMHNPNSEMRRVYQVLLEARSAAIKAMKVGAPLSTVFNAAAGVVDDKLSKFFPKSVGFAMGLELKEMNSTINAKNSAKMLKPNTYYGLQIGFANVRLNEVQKVFSLFVADTVLISEDDGKAHVLTEAESPVDIDAVTVSASAIVLDDMVTDGAPRTRASRRAASSMPDTTKNMETIDKKNLELLDELEASSASKGPKVLSAQKEKYSYVRELLEGRVTAYRNGGQYPSGLKMHEIYVDKDRATVLLPIYGRHVPFHVSSIKGLSKFNSDDIQYLRFNFIDGPAESIFIREISFRTQDPEAFREVEEKIKDVQKKLKAEEAQKQQEVERDDDENPEEALMIDRMTPLRYDELVILPKLGRAKQNMGSVTCHKNGIRFQSSTNEIVDILFKNIRYAFFQPAKDSTVCLIHFHLKRPIPFGKKTTQDVQFREEIEDDVDHLEGRKYRHINSDEEAYMIERKLEKRRMETNKAMRELVEKLNERFDKAGFPGVKFQMPKPSLGFRGNPGRNMSDLAPTKSCLVSLLEFPFFVLPLEDVEVAWLERVSADAKTRNFDIVFVFKDYNKGFVRIDSIERYYYPATDQGVQETLADRVYDLKLWLNANRLPYFDSSVPLNWRAVLQEICKDVNAADDDDDDAEARWNPFSTENGWRSYLVEAGEEDDEDEDSEEDEFRADDASGSEDEDDDASEYVTSDDDDEDFEEEGDEDGEDWDEMEERLQEEDRKRARDEGVVSGGEEDEDERPSKRSKKDSGRARR